MCKIKWINLLKKRKRSRKIGRRQTLHLDSGCNNNIIISNTLKRDIYNLCYPGFPIDQVKQPDPDPLAYIQYSCIHWVDHLKDGDPEKDREHIQDKSKIHKFLKNHLLH
ncbi:hypothetical protein BOTCAL_0983g00020 [Botryotinia calthae]|uniref:Uncharacterized protein n=1 Tax=Botryotinia calthae TaxID=38488 RepID=A0A4Y8CGV6_9HELO|nr:hypothetical protein BOTCAL_0983g00020 [Botryotinia calthae]